MLSYLWMFEEDYAVCVVEVCIMDIVGDIAFSCFLAASSTATYLRCIRVRVKRTKHKARSFYLWSVVTTLQRQSVLALWPLKVQSSTVVLKSTCSSYFRLLYRLTKTTTRLKCSMQTLSIDTSNPYLTSFTLATWSVTKRCFWSCAVSWQNEWVTKNNLPVDYVSLHQYYACFWLLL